MEWIVPLVVGILALAVGFVFGRLHSERATSRALGELEGQRLQTEQQLADLRQQLVERQIRIDALAAELSDQKAQLADVNRQITERQKAFEEQRQLLDRAKETLQETFKALAAESLKSSNTSFLQLAQEKLSAILAEAKGDLGKQKEQIEGLVKPLRETLTRYETQLADVEKARQESYSGLKKHLEMLGKTQTELQTSTSALAHAMRNPQVRGRWGELTLQRAAEIAGMTEYCDFHTQVSTDGKLRPDMVIHLPGGRQIVVDAKVPCEDYLNAVNAGDEQSRLASLKCYAQTVAQHARQLGGKSYWDQFGSDSPEFVVLFLPGESFFSAALGTDHTLIEQAMQNRVILASPTTLIALLRAVAFGWRQEKLAKNAETIREIGNELYERLVSFMGHLSLLGKNLSNTVGNYNDAVGSLERRVFPSARKLNELGITARKEMIEPQPIDHQARQLPPEPAGESQS